MKQAIGLLLEGSFLSPVMATVLGCAFGLVVFVMLNSRGSALDPKIHWGAAIITVVIAAGAINFFLKPNAKMPKFGE